MKAGSCVFHIMRLGTLAILALGLVSLLGLGCRRGMPVIDPTGANPNAAGTISGTVRGPEGTSSIEGRLVEVVNVETGDRQRARTSNVGGFTFKVKPGKYRVSVALLDGESILEQPGEMHVNKSDVDAHADFVIGRVKVLRPRYSAPRNPALGSPVA